MLRPRFPQAFMCVSLPKTPTLLEELLLLKHLRWPALSPRQGWVSSKLTQTLGREIDYYVIDPLDPIRIDRPGQALFVFVFSTSWIQHCAQHIVGLLKSIC